MKAAIHCGYLAAQSLASASSSAAVSSRLSMKSHASAFERPDVRTSPSAAMTLHVPSLVRSTCIDDGLRSLAKMFVRCDLFVTQVSRHGGALSSAAEVTARRRANTSVAG